MLKRIGEPYLSRRPVTNETESEHSGLGLGVFIARTLLERTGAKVSFTNRVFPEHGAAVQIQLAAQPLRKREKYRRTNTLESFLTVTASHIRPWQNGNATPYKNNIQ